MGKCLTSIEDDINLFWQSIESFFNPFMGDELCEGPRVGHCIGGEELTLGQGRRGGGLAISRGGMVNTKFEAHISNCFHPFREIHSCL